MSLLFADKNNRKIDMITLSESHLTDSEPQDLCLIGGNEPYKTKWF